MHSISFSSTAPLDHICRTLDTMRKMGFDLLKLQVEEGSGEGFAVSITLRTHGVLTVGTLIDRISACVGVYDLTHTAEGAGFVHA